MQMHSQDTVSSCGGQEGGTTRDAPGSSRRPPCSAGSQRVKGNERRCDARPGPQGPGPGARGSGPGKPPSDGVVGVSSRKAGPLHPFQPFPRRALVSGVPPPEGPAAGAAPGSWEAAGTPAGVHAQPVSLSPGNTRAGPHSCALLPTCTRKPVAQSPPTHQPLEGGCRGP